jgi:hypothetical protein
MEDLERSGRISRIAATTYTSYRDDVMNTGPGENGGA